MATPKLKMAIGTFRHTQTNEPPRETPRKDVPLQDDDSAVVNGYFRPIDINLIDVSPYQPRKFFDPGRLDALALSLDTAKQSNPIVVRPASMGRFQLIGGERRYRAAKLAGKQTLDAIVRTLTDAEAALLAFADNGAREEITMFEWACAISQLMKEGIITSQQQGADAAGIHKVSLSKAMNFLKFPPKIIERLNERPDAVGYNYAPQFVSLMVAGHEAIVEKHLESIFTDDIDTSVALSNAEAEITSLQQASPDTAKPVKAAISFTPVKSSGVDLFSFRASKEGNVSLKINKDFDPELFMDALTQWAENLDPKVIQKK